MRWLLALGAMAAAIFLLPAQAEPNLRPNIIVIMTDDQRDVDPLTRMPNVKLMLVRHGLRFLNSFAVNPACCPSRATFLSGQYSHNDGVWDNTDMGTSRRI